jgi:cytochrome P450
LLIDVHSVQLVVGDTVAVSHIFVKNTYNYSHPPVFRAFIERLTGRSLLWVEGASEHKRMKALIGPAFSRENVRNMGPILYQVASSLQEHLASQLQSKSTKSIELNAFDRQRLILLAKLRLAMISRRSNKVLTP